MLREAAEYVEGDSSVEGAVFGRLTVISGYKRDGEKCCSCSCECGGEIEARLRDLKRGHTKSCGCSRKEKLSLFSYKHGHCKYGRSPEYTVWSSMIKRCENPNHIYYKHYGGRGIGISKSWRESFKNFLADMGPRPEGMTLDRKDNDGPYSRENCQWATRSQQSKNQRKNGKWGREKIRDRRKTREARN